VRNTAFHSTDDFDDKEGVPWQGWFSATYDSAYAAPVVTYAAYVGAGRTVFAWLIVPTAGRGSCSFHEAVVVGVTGNAVIVQVSVAGGPHLNVSVPLG